MKSLITAFLLMTSLFVLRAESQESYTQTPPSPSADTRPFRLVPTAYLGAGQLRTSGDNSDYERKSATSYGVGLLTEFKGERASFVTGLRFLRQAGRVQWTKADSSRILESTSEFQLDTLGIPALAKLRLPLSANAPTLLLTAGVEAAYQSGATVESKAVFVTSSGTREWNDKAWAKSVLRDVNFLAVAAAGLEVPNFGDRSVYLELTYNRTLLPVNKEDGRFQLYVDSLLLSAGMPL